MEKELRSVLLGLGLPSDEETLAKFSLYASLLKEWNPKINLTSILEDEEIYQKHFIDCILPAKTFDFAGKSILDIGSGGGFPGLVLAILYPTSQITLLDATAKKFIFLKEAVAKLGLNNVSFAIGRIEDGIVRKEGFDVAISRGFASLPIFLEVAAPFVKIGGAIFAMKGARGEEEIQIASRYESRYGVSLKTMREEALPSGDKRINVLYQKNNKTPQKYPRSWGLIKKEFK